MPANIHATAIVLADRGVLIAGPSGSGKTGLAFALISHARSCGLFARLVGDDQLFLSAHSGRLICVAPATIAGLAEVRGIGPTAVQYEPGACVDLLVRLVAVDAPRFAESDTELLAGGEVPRLTLAAGDHDAALFAVASRLSLPPFD